MFNNSDRQKKEQRLAKRLQEGDKEVIGILYDAYAPVLLGLIIKIVRNREIAESVLHDTFLVIWMQKGTYEQDKMGFLTWLIMTAKETAIASIKSDKYRNFPKGEEITTFTNIEQVDMEEQDYLLNPNAACNLSPNEKAALDLIYLKGYSIAEAATTLGVPIETLKTSLKMAIKQLGAEPTL